MRRRNHKAVLNEIIARKTAPMLASSRRLRDAAIAWVLGEYVRKDPSAEQLHEKLRECALDLGRAWDEVPEIDDLPASMRAEPGLAGLFAYLVVAARTYHWSGGATGGDLDLAAVYFTAGVCQERGRLLGELGE